jgi:hypothetical protein
LIPGDLQGPREERVESEGLRIQADKPSRHSVAADKSDMRERGERFPRFSTLQDDVPERLTFELDGSREVVALPNGERARFNPLERTMQLITIREPKDVLNFCGGNDQHAQQSYKCRLIDHFS